MAEDQTALMTKRQGPRVTGVDGAGRSERA